MDRVVFSVHQINEYVRKLLNRDPILQRVWVRGEISNFKLHPSGHMYFSLKDETDKIRCVCFARNAAGINFTPADGMRVLAGGCISLYCRDGQYQLYVKEMEKDGVGDLYIAFEALKKKLKREGLFDPKFKKPIPRFPEKIAVITSHVGAAVRDIINVTRRRYPCVDVLVIPVMVQGASAPGQIRAALDYANTRDDIDVIILGRGGGSIEELWAFNEEEVARAIFRSRIPVISAVGHETDFTIADFVADLRAPTPSAAAEVAVPELSALKNRLLELQKRLVVSVSRIIDNKRKKLEHLTKSYVFRYPHAIIDQYQQQLDQLFKRLCDSMKDLISRNRERLATAMAALEALNPMAILSRGYAMVTLRDSGVVVSSITQLEVGDRVTLRLKDGVADCRVAKKHLLDKEKQLYA